MNIRSRIVTTYLATAIGGLVLAGLLIDWNMGRHLERRHLEELSAQLESFTTRAGDGSPCTLYSLWSGASAPRLDLPHLFVISPEGRDLCDPVAQAADGGLSPPARMHALKATRGMPVSFRGRDGESGEGFFLVATPLRSESTGRSSSAVVVLTQSSARLDQTVSTLRTTLTLGGTLVLLVVLAVSVQLSKRLAAPVIEVVHTARAIARGDVQQRVSSLAGGEFGQLASAVNEMAEKLSSDIDRLNGLERVRSEFLGNVSHELRTPIFSMQGFLETLLDGAMNDPSVNRDFLEKAYRHAERLNTLLNDLIEISRIQSGDMKMSFRYFPVLSFLQQVADEHMGDAARMQISLGVAAEVDASEQVYGDRDRLKQVMINLIDNAIKYTQPGGKIVLQVRRLKHQCEITVEDTGCGISEAHLPRIFERFYRVDRDRSRGVGGTGLGLSIVKHIVEAHGGTIRAESVIGKGSRFIFTLKR